MLLTFDKYYIEGNIPESVVDFIKRNFKKVKIKSEDNKIIDECDWYKEIKTSLTPADNLKGYRELTGLTQQELGDKISVSAQRISDMENGQRSISKVNAKKFADFFKTSTDMFL